MPLSEEARQVIEVGRSAAQLIRDGKPSEAARILDLVLSQGETSELWNDWASAEFACGHLVRAEWGYRRALSLEGLCRQAAVNLALLLLTQGRAEESIPVLEPHQGNLSEEEREVIGNLTSRSQLKVTQEPTIRSIGSCDNPQPGRKGSAVRPTRGLRGSPSPYSALTLSIGSAKRQFFYRPQSSDEGVINQIFRDRDYNLARLRRCRELLDFAGRGAASRRSPLIVDAGANIGASPVFFSSAFQGARIVAVEPDAGNFDLLRGNTEGLAVDCLQAAVRSRPGRVKVVDAGQGFWGYRTEATGAADFGLETASCVTINDVYSSYSYDSFPFIVKVDIEGGEAELFSANTEWVSWTPLIIIELHDWLLPGKATSRPFLHCIAEHDRDFVHIGENVFSIANDLRSIVRS